MSRAEPPAGRETFELALAVRPEDIDANGHVNNVVYLRWIQDVAIAHWCARASAEEQARWAWVVRRHEIDYLRPLKPGDPARALTWVGEPHGPRFDRFVRIEGPRGTCAASRTEWVLLDGISGRPSRVTPALLQPFLLPNE